MTQKPFRIGDSDRGFQSNCNLEIRQSTIYYGGLLGRWDKQIVDQESDVPSIILSIDWGHSKLYFCNFIRNKKINLKDFCKEFCKKLWEKIILGTSDICPRDPAFYIEDCRISKDTKVMRAQRFSAMFTSYL